MILHLFDATQYIYAGVQNKMIGEGYAEIGGVCCAKEMPCAGITNLLNTYNKYKTGDNLPVFCFDGVPVKKRKLHESLFPTLGGYKGGRAKKTLSNIYQRGLAVDLFKQLGLPMLYHPELEADDVIATAVSEYRRDFDEIVIHSRDSDLYYLVCDNVSVEPVLRQGKFVNRSNWEKTVWKDSVLPYNLITLEKMCNGESGDNIPYVYADPMNRIYENLPEHRYSEMGNNEVLREYILSIVGEEDKRTLGIFDLIAPILDSERVSLEEEYELNSESDYCAMCALCGCNGYDKYSKKLSSELEELVEDYVSRYVEEQIKS